MSYLKIIRPYNLALIIIAQCLIKFVLFPSLGADIALGTMQFLLLILSTVLIAGAGNVINDINDVDIDLINRPDSVLVGKKIPVKAAYNYFVMLNSAGVISGFILANSLQKPGLAAIFIVVSAVLYIYATQLKAIILVGNLVISILVAFSLLIVIVFDIYPAIDQTINASQLKAATIVLHYAGFAFLVNLLREFVKDLEDINGDKNGGVNSIAINLGRTRTTQLVFAFAVILIIGLILYLYSFLYNWQLMVLYFLFLIIAPLIYFCINCLGAERKKEYARLSLLLKLIMFSGLLSMICYKFI